MISSKPVKNPFPGLRPFETDEYRLFFGREGQSDELLARLQRSRFLAVVGTSGSGKSSLIRAGLMPALRGGMMKEAGSGWRIAVMRPGGDPIGNLAAELVKKDVLSEAGAGLPEQEAEAVIEATLRSGSLGIVNVARQARLSEHEKLLVVVDQFEELFRFRAAHESTGVDEASAFVKLLLEAAQQRELSIYVVLTMRSDFLGDCAQFQGLPEAINDGQYLIPRMTRDERRFAVTGPVGVTRGKISEPLINRLLNDVGDNPDQLPILQHALMRTWEHWQAHRRNGEPIGIEHYDAIGTMSDALSRHADEAFNELPDERSRLIAEILFTALSDRGVDNREIRRPTRLDTVCEIAEARMEEVIAVIDVFRGGGRSFLMPPAGTALHADSVIDISHESLIRNWQRLKDWVNKQAQSVRVYRRVAEAAVLHREGSEALLQDPALAFALDWREKLHPNAAWGERYHPEFNTAMEYLEQSRIAREERISAEEIRRNEEIARDKRELEQTKLFVAQQTRAARRMHWLIVLLCVILLLALATAAYALNLRAAAISDRENAVRATELAEDANRRATKEAAAARESESKALKAQEATAVENKRAEAEAKRANDQAAVALQNLHAAQIATKKATAATIVAQENAQQLAGALKRGELVRVGLESSRREDFVKARDAFQELQEKLKALQPNALHGQSFTAEQSKQFSRDYGWTLSRLGDTQHKMGEFEKAIEDYENGRVILEQVLKNEPALILFETYHGLAHAYHDSASKLTPARQAEQLSNAEEFYKKAAAYQEQFKSGNPLIAVTSLKNLAQLYIDIGKYDGAEARLKSVVHLYQTVEERPGDGTMGALKELAEFYRGRTKYEDAARTYNELIDIQEKQVSERSDNEGVPELSDNYSELGQIYNALKDEERGDASFILAEKLQQIVLKIKRRGDLLEVLQKSGSAITFDEDLDIMGDNYLKLGRVKEAKRVYEGALLIREQIKSENDARGLSYLKLARLYHQYSKDYGKAETYYKLIIELRRNAKGNLTGDTDPLKQYVAGSRQLAALYIDQLNKPAEAEELLKSALTALSPVPGRLGWEEKTKIYSTLLSLYDRQNKREKIENTSISKLAAMTRRRGYITVNEKRTPFYRQFLAEYVKTVDEVADIYIGRADKALAEKTYHSVIEYWGPTGVLSSLRDPIQVDNYVTLLEKYKTLLEELKKPAETKRVDEIITRGRARQKELESLQKEDDLPAQPEPEKLVPAATPKP